MITGLQVRMALAALRWSREVLAERSGLSRRTIQRLTDIDGVPPRMTVANLSAIQTALEREGVQFVPDGVVFKSGSA